MRKALRVLAIAIGIIALFIIGAGFYIKSFLPDVGPAPEMKIVSTPEKIAHGKYLATNVMICMDCHSTRNWNFYAAPIGSDSLGMGGELFDQRAGFPGAIYSANITPAGIGNWTDGEIFRAVTTGVRKNGKAIFPLMPHENYGTLDPQDIESVICYLRTLPAIGYTPPESEYDFPMNFIINTIPKKANFSKKPDSSDRLAYGKYMITAAACGNCHIPSEKGKLDSALLFAGGNSFNLPAGIITSANLTPDKETGIGNWTKEMFLNKFRPYRDSAYAHRPIDFMKDISTVMPWPVYAGMSDNDLGAIYEYLQSLKPIKNNTIRFQPYPAQE
jgi:hypothetical protein